MKDEELAAIKARSKACYTGWWLANESHAVLRKSQHQQEPRTIAQVDSSEPSVVDFLVHAYNDIDELLAEVEAWREIGRELARPDTFTMNATIELPDEWNDDAAALQAKARALLGHPVTSAE